MKKLLVLLLLLSTTVMAAELDTKIGQKIIVSFDGDSVKSKGFKKAVKLVKTGQISGVILFTRNIKSQSELTKMNKVLLSSAKTTPFISIDNEGGKIQRYDFEKYPSAKQISKKDEAYARHHYSRMAEMEQDLGINLNFAPCVDLKLNPHSIIKKKDRSYSKDPEIVDKYARIFIEEHNERNIITSIKHFPGHGSVKGDTHKGMVDATNTARVQELKPYYDLADFSKMNTVMVSHIYNSNIDDKYPASLSSKTIKDILINDIGYNGVIVSDDYDMGAIKDNYSLKEIVVNSINSGVDIMLFSSRNPKLPAKIHKIVKNELKKGNINIEDINKSYEKIIELKRNYEKNI